MVTKEEVWDKLREVYDPELGLSIVDLGFIYDVKVENEKNVYVKMTLTTPGCPMSFYLVRLVEAKIRSIKDVSDVKVELVWDPPWTPDRMSEKAKKKLGLI